MKIGCPCGATIRDQTDNLPHKAHLIPDQEWFPTFDAIDGVIDDVIAKRTNGDAAYIAIRRILGDAARHVYQCRICGRLFVYDRQPVSPVCSGIGRSSQRDFTESRWR